MYIVFSFNSLDIPMVKIGFKKLQSKLEKKWYSEESSGKIAYTIGKNKYGKMKMAKMSARGKKK
jgi:hypothetical protein